MQKLEIYMIKSNDSNPYVVIHLEEKFVAYPYIETLRLGIIFALFSTILFGRDVNCKELFMLNSLN